MSEWAWLFTVAAMVGFLLAMLNVGHRRFHPGWFGLFILALWVVLDGAPAVS